MRILIAEDDSTSRAMLAAVLRMGGHEVVETADGQEALDAMTRLDAPPMAILDWMMPKKDGPDVVRCLREREWDYSPYLVLLTAKDKKEDIISGLECGANDYLTKPFDVGELRARVEVGKRMLDLQEALNSKVNELRQTLAEVKALRGILPICAQCKKIRDDAGYWQQVEDYVHAHSEARFSHGVCPECMKALYPDFQDDEDEDEDKDKDETKQEESAT